MRLQEVRRLLVVDVEATCCAHDDDRLRFGNAAQPDISFPDQEMEIIEIGAVLVVRQGVGQPWFPKAEFQALVRPVRHPHLSEFCQRLTTLRQDDVSQAAGFSEVANDLRNFIQRAEETAGAAMDAWGSWGDFDRLIMARDSGFHQAVNPLGFAHVDLKDHMIASHGVMADGDFAHAFNFSGLDWHGTQHRALADARQIARLLPWIVGDRRLR